MKSLIVLLSAGAVMFAQTPPPAKSAAPAAKSAAPATKSATPVSNALLHPETLKAKAPDSFKAKFTTTKGDFTVEVHRAWAPLGADRFYNLVKNRYYTNASFFRVLPNFIVQFGMAADPKIGAAWENANIKDDAVRTDVHNTKGTVVFAKAGPNTRTTQIFINIADNSRGLDAPMQPGFTPFGEITDGMDVILKLYSGYGEGSDSPGGHGPTQDRVTKEGKPYLDKNFPLLDSIKTAVIEVPEGTAAPAATKAGAPATKSTSAPPATKK